MLGNIVFSPHSVGRKTQLFSLIQANLGHPKISSNLHGLPEEGQAGLVSQDVLDLDPLFAPLAELRPVPVVSKICPVMLATY